MRKSLVFRPDPAWMVCEVGRFIVTRGDGAFEFPLNIQNCNIYYNAELENHTPPLRLSRVQSICARQYNFEICTGCIRNS